MFTFLFLLFLIGAGAIVISGLKKKNTTQITFGIIGMLLVTGFFQSLDFWGEKLWYDALGYTNRFWVLELSKYGFALAGFFLGVAFVWLLLLNIPRERRWIRYVAMVLGALFAMMWGYGNWPVLLLFMNKVPTELLDPIFSMPTSFYFFSLPFYESLLSLLIALTVLSTIAALLSVFVEPDMWRQFNWNQRAFSGFADPSLYNPLFTTTGAFLILLAVSKYFDRFGLMLSGSGVVYGPGWTDVNVRIPMIWLVLVICALVGFILLIPGLRNKLRYWLAGRFSWLGSSPTGILIIAFAFLVAVWVVALGVIPGMFQNFKVNANEITLEQPFILNNIKFTREAYDLTKVQEREYPVVDRFTSETVAQNEGIFSNIRLWDYRALDAVYKQFQEFRLYYEFEDIDIDRYRYNGDYKQVMISAREMDVNNLPAQSQTFVNRRFKYTHGFGVVMNDVSEFTASGLPDLLIKNIPPVSKFPELALTQPRIYYGEGSSDYVVVNSSETEFDYPSGDENAYVQYDGKGGVSFGNLWRQFLYAYKFDETKLLFSGYPRAESRIMFHRNIMDRVKRLAPFLHYDNDPYIVLAEGKLYWMIDAYTVSGNYPYSQPFSSLEDVIFRGVQPGSQVNNNLGSSMRGVNYVRNSVKVVVDAYEGDVDYYMFDEEDPLIRSWNKVVPGLMKPWQEMPESLLNHIRYPENLLLIQGAIFAKYHMTDPTVFYNQEDLWVRATEKYYDRVQPVEPYYIMWKLPGEEDLSFVQMMPFTPKNRQVMIGWLAGMCDPENYGELIAYHFPKDKRVLGPQQVETKIDQDATLAAQLSLWDQRGSSVIRGNVLAIPVNETLFYVEPIYLQAETAAYPELRLVVVMHNDQIAYAPTFEGALEQMLMDTQKGAIAMERAATDEEEAEDVLAGEAREAVTVSPELNERIKAANQAFEDYLKYTGEKDFQRASEAMQRLEENLKALNAPQ